MKVKIGDKIDAQLIRNSKEFHGFTIGSIWEWEHWRDGKLIDTWKEGNVCTAKGLNALLDIMFHASTQITTWYVEIFETDTTPADGTTYAVPVYTPSTSYDEGTRPAYNEAAASSKVITNSANKAVFTISATKTIYGAALVGGGLPLPQRLIPQVAELYSVPLSLRRLRAWSIMTFLMLR